MSSSRRYIKRVWRVPKDRGPIEYFAAIVVKSLVKHGWPARATLSPHFPSSFMVNHIDFPDWDGTPADFAGAVSVAVRIAARTHRIEVTEDFGVVQLLQKYTVTAGGFFKHVGPLDEYQDDISG